MNILAIETATSRAGIALAKGDKILVKQFDGAKEHAERILPAIDELCEKLELSLDRLDAIAYGKGPGSFTGLRVGLSIAKGIAFAQDLPLYPVISLFNIASQVFRQDGVDSVLSVVDARMQQLYWALYKKGDTKSKIQVSDAKDINIAEPVTIAGVGFQNYQDNFEADLKNKIIATAEIYPCPKEMIFLVKSGLILPEKVEDALPLYIRNQVTGSPKSG